MRLRLIVSQDEIDSITDIMIPQTVYPVLKIIKKLLNISAMRHSVMGSYKRLNNQLPWLPQLVRPLVPVPT